ncbi:flavin reductase family protein [Cereibacter sphaeroides]|uniref:flavin reductase family protein n=1 Tax=Cereibacter sphaeroides TaxID=1063 RepID=UPI003990CA24
MSAPDQAQEFREAMSRLASGVSLVTTRSLAGVPHGMLATAVTSVSAAPPMLLVCINRSATLLADLLEREAFCVNFLGAHHQDLAGRFFSAEGRAQRFQTGPWTELATGVPVLGDSLAALDCRLDRAVEAGTHSVLFGRVEAIRLSPPGEVQPMIHYLRQYRRLECPEAQPSEAAS